MTEVGSMRDYVGVHGIILSQGENKMLSMKAVLVCLALIAAVEPCVALSSSAVATPSTSPVYAGQTWTPEVSVEVRYSVHDQERPEALPYPGASSAVVPSPDGDHFLFVTRHGDLESDRNVYELHVFNAKRVLGALAMRQLGRGTFATPVAAATFEASSTHAGIKNARWEVDGSAVLFLAGDESGSTTQIWRLDVRTGSLRH